MFVGLSAASHFSSGASDFVLSLNASILTSEDSGLRVSLCFFRCSFTKKVFLLFSHLNCPAYLKITLVSMSSGSVFVESLAQWSVYQNV